jgi:hypothetical protein
VVATVAAILAVAILVAMWVAEMWGMAMWEDMLQEKLQGMITDGATVKDGVMMMLGALGVQMASGDPVMVEALVVISMTLAS